MFRLHRDVDHRAASWGLVLAAGEGKRLRSYIHEIRGDDLPKQYVNFIGRRSMLEHTFERAKKLIPVRQILTIVSRDHLRFAEVQHQLSHQPKQNIIVQPENKETGPGIFLPLMYLYKRCPEAIVSVFPSDHFIVEEERFMDHVELAVKAVAHDPSRIILLAMEARGPEVDYGYIVPRPDDGGLNLWGTRHAANFVEKPNAAMARELIKAGGLWNTMIMVFKVRTLAEMMKRLFPKTHLRFARIFDAIGTPEESRTIEAVYQTLEPLNFSKGFLETIAAIDPAIISVLPVLQVFWSDWGSPERILQAREMLIERARTPKPMPAKVKRHPACPLIWRSDSA